MDHALKCAMQEQAKAAVLDGQWEQLRFLGNRFERAGCYAEAWNALAERVEKTSTQTLPIWPGPKAISNGVLVLPRSRPTVLVVGLDGSVTTSISSTQFASAGAA